jgi:hypothetical protein
MLKSQMLQNPNNSKEPERFLVTSNNLKNILIQTAQNGNSYSLSG